MIITSFDVRANSALYPDHSLAISKCELCRWGFAFTNFKENLAGFRVEFESLQKFLAIILVNYDLSHRFGLRHFDFFCAAILKVAVLSIAHHHVEVGIVLVIQNSDHLVVEVQFVLGRVLVVLNS